jgi:hypothetical protein
MSYHAQRNRLEVIGRGENMTRYIPCENLRPNAEEVRRVKNIGQEIWVFFRPLTSSRQSK